MNKISLQALPRTFFSRSTRAVARELLGSLLVRRLNGHRLSGMIVEAEAYIGEEDLACHAKAGKTARTEVMYGPAGFSYVYFTYGMHWMLNVVTEEEGFPAAVLIRAIQPTEGIELMQQFRRGKGIPDLCDGPAKLTQALQITRAQNGLDLSQPCSEIFIAAQARVPNRKIFVSPRVGLGNTPEPWYSKPWRFLVRDSPFVSKA